MSCTQRLCAVGKAGHGGFRLKARVTDSMVDMGRRGGGEGGAVTGSLTLGKTWRLTQPIITSVTTLVQ